MATHCVGSTGQATRVTAPEGSLRRWCAQNAESRTGGNLHGLRPFSTNAQCTGGASGMPCMRASRRGAMACQQQPSRSGLTDLSLEVRLMPNVPLDLVVRISNGFWRCSHNELADERLLAETVSLQYSRVVRSAGNLAMSSKKRKQDGTDALALRKRLKTSDASDLGPSPCRPIRSCHTADHA